MEKPANPGRFAGYRHSHDVALDRDSPGPELRLALDRQNPGERGRNSSHKETSAVVIVIISVVSSSISIDTSTSSTAAREVSAVGEMYRSSEEITVATSGGTLTLRNVYS